MSNGATPTVYTVSGPPSAGVSPVAPTLADAITAAQSSASQAGSSASSASTSASAAATSAALAAAAETAVAAAESTVVADLNIAQADIVQLQNQINLINQTAATLIGDIGAAESAASAAETAQGAAATSASTASTAATNASASASAASTSASAASTSASGASASAAAAAASALSVNAANLLQVSNNLSELTATASTARTNIGAAPLASPTFTGVPAAPTAAPSTNTTQIATTAFVLANASGAGQLLAANNLSDLANKATARVNLGVDQRTARGDANYIILNTDRVVAINVAFTAPRTFTLPAASTVNAGALSRIIDEVGAVTATNTLTLAPNGSDKINNVNATVTFSDTFGDLILECNGATGWTFGIQGIDRGGTGAITASAARTNLGLTSAATMSLPVSIANGGTGASAASGTVLDNLTGFSGTGVLKRTGAGAYSFLTDVLETGVTATISVGYNITPFSGGTVSSGTYTPAAANGNYQYLTNNGAFTLAVPAADGAIDILVTNGASAGVITFAGGYTVGSSTGSSLTTTNGNKFIISIRTINGVSTYSIYALQ
jgi:hypothetical protein